MHIYGDRRCSSSHMLDTNTTSNLSINLSEPLVVGLCPSVAAVSVAVWTYQLRAASHGRLSDSFSSLWAAFTLTTHINTLYNERV